MSAARKANGGGSAKAELAELKKLMKLIEDKAKQLEVWCDFAEQKAYAARSLAADLKKWAAELAASFAELTKTEGRRDERRGE